MKKQIKKSLSLFLAVLMLMTSWVWVAPEKAAAAGEVEAGKFYFKFVIGKIEEAGNSGNWEGNTLTINYKKHDESNGTKTVNLDKDNYNDEGATDVVVWEGWIDGFPTSAGWYMKMKYKAAASVYLNADNCYYVVGKDAANCSNIVSNTDSFKWQNDAIGQGTKDATFTLSALEEKYPVLNGIEATATPETVELAKVNTGVTSQSTISVGGFVDQYGVKWTGAVNSTFTLRADGVDLTDSYASIEQNGHSATVTIRPWLQTLFPNRASTKLYVDWTVDSSKDGTVDSSKAGTQTIDVDFSDYGVIFRGNGGKVGDNSSTALEEIEYKDAEMYIGSVINMSPAFASRDGFEFMGYYSKQNADALGKDTAFIGEKFVDGVTKVPSEDKDIYSYDDNEYKKFIGDTVWYAAWQAAPLNVKFLTADNQHIATLTGRHNNNMTANNMYDGLSNLNAAVKAAYTGNSIKFNDSDNTPVYKDGASSYVFAGWRIIEAYDKTLVDKVIKENNDVIIKGDITLQATYKLASAEKYSVYFEDGNNNKYKVVDKDDNTVGDKYYSYRDSVILPSETPEKAQDDTYSYEFIGWAKDIGVDYYTVDESNKDETGAVIVYTHKNGAEFTVAGDASYVPVFRRSYRNYKVTFNYKVDGNSDVSKVVDGYHWDDVVKMPEIATSFAAGGNSYKITGWKVGSDSGVRQLKDIKINGDVVLTAAYGYEGVAKYTINFYGKAEDGETDVLLNADSNIYVDKDPVAAPEVPANIKTDKALYTFAGWSPAVKATASAHADYYATYTKQEYADVYFYNYDGTLIYKVIGNENGRFVGKEIPEFENKIDGVNVLPERAEDAVGKYTFDGWKDSAGNVVVPGTDNFESAELHLYAQFKTKYKEYTVKFVDEDKVISEKGYHYGDPIDVPADPVKEADLAYSYEFRGWSPDVARACAGNAVYAATFRKTAKYYSVTWFKDDKKTVLSESNYRYGTKINQAVAKEPLTYGQAAEGYTWTVKEWIQCTAEGVPVNAAGEADTEANAVRFARGQVMEGKELYFYPVFEAKANMITVKFYKADGTTEIGEAKIPYGANLRDYEGDFAVKAIDKPTATHHYVVDKWVALGADDTAPEVKVVNNDVKAVKAVCAAEEHTWETITVIHEATYNVPGYEDQRCTSENCALTKHDVETAVLDDEDKPTGSLYVDINKWSTGDVIDFEDVKYVSPSAKLIVSANDTGRGVGTIEYYVSKSPVDPSTITDWAEIYNIEEVKTEVRNSVLRDYKINFMEYSSYTTGTAEQRMKKAEIDRVIDTILEEYNANATSVLSTLNLENGKEYVIYIKISDRAGNGIVNTSYLSSSTLSYGTKAPEITVSGEGYGAKFCDKADVRIVDDADRLEVYLDGEEVSAYTNPGTTSANGTFVATFETEEAGVHTVTVIDKHGNKSTKIFEIKGDHTYRNYTIAATCDNNGSRYDLCTVCGSKANETVLYAEGHSYTDNFVEKAADCINNGYRTYVCDNNCGTKLIVNFNNETNTWNNLEVAKITEEAVEHLKATGVHTFEMVKDENGEDTTEEKWVDDKAATCKITGSKHRDCTKCGYREIEEISVDTVNGHKFYREKVTKEPTCTEKGEKTKTCRYCGHVEKVSDVDALGHTEGEYRIIKAATCEVPGSKIRTCEVCKVDMGEAIEIPATNHAWKISGEVYKGEDDKYYQNYECKNDSAHTKYEEVKGYQPPVAAVITFDFGENGGYFSVPAVGTPGTEGYKPESTKDTQTINAYVGETISANEVEKALKQSNETNTFSFSHWEDADGKEVKFPVEVKGDATYYAVFSEKFVNYTVTYYKEDGVTEYKKTGYLHNGDKVTLADAPSKAATNLVTYKFAGWVVIGSDPEVVYTDEVTIDGANINLKAKYTDVKKQYAVTYAYSKSDILETFAVEAGTKARDCAIVPEKKADSKYHYVFKAWNRAEQLKNVESNIYTTPEFDAALHEGNYVITEKTPAACGINRVDTYTCSCGYTFDKEIAGTAFEHKWGVPKYDETTGKNVVSCIREGCGFTDADTRTFTIKFFVDTEEVDKVPYIPWGTTIAATRLPVEPEKDSTATTDYTFKGWALKGTTDVIDVTKYVVKADTEFVAVFEGTTREYSVVFAYDANNVIKTFTKVKAGSSVTFDGAKPVKVSDENYHYTFSNWQGYAAGVAGAEQIITVTDIQSDLYILAKFSYAKHAYDNVTYIGEATCTQGIGERHTCTGCDKYYEITGKPLDHDFSIEIDRKEATLTEEGYIVYKCATCPAGKEATFTKKIDKLESTTTYINVKVQDSEGRPLAGASVDLYVGTNYMTTVNTNSEGEVNFLVDKGESYSFIVEYDGEDITGGLRAAEVGEDKVNTVVVNISNCSCACHGDGIWSAIFRFFHKLIKMFTGEFKCCKDPDPRYN